MWQGLQGRPQVLAGDGHSTEGPEKPHKHWATALTRGNNLCPKARVEWEKGKDKSSSGLDS